MANEETTQPAAEWSIAQSLSGRHVLLTGATGFLGKVYAAMLLKYHPDIEQLYLLVRSHAGESAEDRFRSQVAGSTAFDPLRESYGEAFDEFLAETVTVLDGDITDDHLGLDEADAKRVARDLDLVINSAGLTNFNPNLESALQINTLSQLNFLDFLRLADEPAAYMHVSTCFVAGNQTGRIPEELPGPTRYPAYDELGVDFDAEREIRDCLDLIDHAKSMAEDQERQSLFASKVKKRLEADNLPVDDDALWENTYRDVRDRWLRKHLSEQGRERAEHWGWPNIYTYTKSLGERLLADADDIDISICRPAIIEASQSFPTQGWIQGVNTSGPLCYLIYRGHRFVPTRKEMKIDLVPVDAVSKAMLTISGALIEGRHKPVYQIGSSDLNPVSTHRMVELTQLGTRRILDDDDMSSVKRLVLKSADSMPVTPETFERISAPQLRRAAEGVGSMLDRIPTDALGGFGEAVEAVKSGVDQVRQAAWTTEKFFDIFMPFVAYNNYRFQAQNIVDLVDTLTPAEAQRYRPGIEDLDWRDYWINTQLPALHEHIFPELDQKLSGRSEEAHTYRDLLELFDATTVHHADQVAMRHHDGGTVEQYSYRDLRQSAHRVASALQHRGIREHSAVLLAGENRPQWGMCYFGILKAGGIAVPVDPEASVQEFVDYLSTSRAAVAILSDQVYERVGEELKSALDEADIPARITTFGGLLGEQLETDLEESDVEPLAPEAVEPHESLVHTAEDAGDLASLIFTSGTTGQPKGVMLTHENFTHLLTNLQQTFSIDDDAEFVSVLPLHHTFEFACGFLLPLSEGASITYLEELDGTELLAAAAGNRASALVGVPALWELLYKRIEGQVDAAPRAVSWALRAMHSLNTTLRDRWDINVGPVVFAPVHQAFGGDLEYLVSGGAALPGDILEAFYGLGFDLYEGYGLSEASPVLTVNQPDDGITPGSVGTALPDVEVDIHDPNDEGVGEVIARGPNVMPGYLDRPEANEETLRDGWLHTGDLGKIDENGELRLVGRQKDVIVTSGGKNVYPDQLEDLYGGHEDIAEISVVGLSDGDGSERVACLIRPDLAEDADAETREAAQENIREWFQVQAARTASHKRIRVLRFHDEPLPRTATRKVKRNEVREILRQKLDQEKAEARQRGADQEGDWAWLDQVLAHLSDRDAQAIHAGTHLYDDLGFDSLMFVELASLLEERDYTVDAEDLASLQTNADLRELLGESHTTEADQTALVKADGETNRKARDWDIPPIVADTGKRVLGDLQMSAYENLYDVDVYGRSNIPRHNPNTIVVANHCSHLDMGLVKYALGDYGRGIRALAASDYFFSTPLRRAYFENFTNLLPIERSSTLEEALAEADDALERGETLLIFPEGTRSVDGTIQPFQSGIGYLVDRHDVDVLPLYIDGTYEALPKGQSLPSPMARHLEVHIGRTLGAADLKRSAGDQRGRDRFQAIADTTREAVTSLRDSARGADGPPLEPLFESLQDRFENGDKDKVNGTSASYYFTLGDDPDHKWSVEVHEGECRIHRGKPEEGEADCVVKTSPVMARRMLRDGYVPSMEEFMNGDIKTNDPELLRDFRHLFNF
jgi:long-chain acyl-CoA synthetase